MIFQQLYLIKYLGISFLAKILQYLPNNMSSMFPAVHGVKQCKIYLVPVINIDNSFKYCIVKIVNLLLLIKQMKHAISIYKQRSSFRSLLSSNIW